MGPSLSLQCLHFLVCNRDAQSISLQVQHEDKVRGALRHVGAASGASFLACHPGLPREPFLVSFPKAGHLPGVRGLLPCCTSLPGVTHSSRRSSFQLKGDPVPRSWCCLQQHFRLPPTAGDMMEEQSEPLPDTATRLGKDRHHVPSDNVIHSFPDTGARPWGADKALFSGSSPAHGQNCQPANGRAACIAMWI